ncbi:hypothetical protein C0J52_18883 [Blattella germanica]|nr:hypothetical protein C0J52_18883 [Blattella germanica]
MKRPKSLLRIQNLQQQAHISLFLKNDSECLCSRRREFPPAVRLKQRNNKYENMHKRGRQPQPDSTLTLLVLIVESHWTSGSGRNPVGVTGKNSSSGNDCGVDQEYVVLEECHPCTTFEINSKINDVCLATHSKEIIKCSTSGKVIHRSCAKVTWLEERNFWIFEASMFALGIFFTIVVFSRQKMLDHQMLRRIQRQLASGV